MARAFIWRTAVSLGSLTWTTQMTGPGVQLQATLDYLSDAR